MGGEKKKVVQEKGGGKRGRGGQKGVNGGMLPGVVQKDGLG